MVKYLITIYFQGNKSINNPQIRGLFLFAGVAILYTRLSVKIAYGIMEDIVIITSKQGIKELIEEVVMKDGIRKERERLK